MELKKCQIVKKKNFETKFQPVNSSDTEIMSDNEVYIAYDKFRELNFNELTSDDDGNNEDFAQIKNQTPQDIQKSKTNIINTPIEIVNFLKGIHVFFWPDIPQKQKHDLSRLVCSANGNVESKFTEKTTHIVSNTWHDDFNKAINKSPSIAIVSPLWIIECCNGKKLAKTSSYHLQSQ